MERNFKILFGSEINRINDNLELTHYNFEEIMGIIIISLVGFIAK